MLDMLDRIQATERRLIKWIPQTQQSNTRISEGWPKSYVNHETLKPYTPHHEGEREFVYSDTPRNALAKGGEGGGKSVAGIIKTLDRLRRGCTGIFVSPDFEHFKKSLWPEFRRWCPRAAVIERERYRLDASWEPTKPFALHFNSEAGSIATLYCGGIEDPTGWEGPNVNFAHFDEARRHKTPDALKVLSGRVRIPGPGDIPPQLYFTTTPAKHWLFDYFGPAVDNDPLASFKSNALTITLLTKDNEAAGNLNAGFTELRGQSLTENEKAVLLDAEWQDIASVDGFLSSMHLWDACEDRNMPELDPHTPVILAMDAGESDDTFGTALISRHWKDDSLLAVRYAHAYVPVKGQPLDFDQIEQDIRDLVTKFAVQQIAYDPFLLGQMIRRLQTAQPNKSAITAPCEQFPQGAARLEADKGLLDLITWRRIVHNGNEQLRQHISNADKKTDVESRKLRIVKRMQSLKIDLAVCLSMGCARAGKVLFEKGYQWSMAEW